MAPLLVHVGMHKTGTTHLQRSVLPHVAGASYRRGALVDELMRWLAAADDDGYDPALAGAVGSWLARGDLPAIVSWEGLSGTLWEDPVGSRARTTRRIADLGDDVHVLVTIRRQDHMLRSVYAQYVNEGGPLDDRTFVRRAEAGTLFDLRHLLYDDLVERYRAALGPERVHVMVYEAYRADPGVLAGVLAEALGVRTPSSRAAGTTSGTGAGSNPSVDGLGLLLLRTVNRWFRESKFVPDPPLRIRRASMARGILQGRASFTSRVGRRSDPWAHVPEAFRAEIRASNERLARWVPAVAEAGYSGA